ncbi:hypothetical protein [Falcatimonas sp. MSJ-15]|uniref:hypothetical protein n=1 Tax=Falcatimonas sp. MSJ-15 TaxID=2841515 RepID=UPI00209FEF0B|nr:hypothetical protein [Falcatimonas sp. MSJ-15]
MKKKIFNIIQIGDKSNTISRCFNIFITTLGRAMAICIAYLGVGVVAIPTGIISAGFSIFLVLRDDLSVLPQRDTVLKMRDIIIIRANEN